MTLNHTPTSKNFDEGVIKFDLEFKLGPSLGPKILEKLNACRQILYRLGLTGREPTRYQGLAYGNVSIRAGINSFIISGTQTGAKTCLSPDDYCLITDFDVTKNRVQAEGPIEPSSESLTHGSIYQANLPINCVLHIHSPILWRNTAQLGIVQTNPTIAYGTPEMALAVGQASRNLNNGIISMGGHEDGLIAFAETIDAATLELANCLAEAEKLGH